MSVDPQQAPDGLRVVVTGATGNLGTGVVHRLGRAPEIREITGLARRVPDRPPPAKTHWVAADVTADTRLVELFTGAAAVVHLAWRFHPARRPAVTWQTNVVGSARVFRAAAEAGVPAVVYASSVAAYSPHPGERAVDERWPTHGWPAATYCRENAYLERMLDVFEATHPRTRVVRLRPGLVVARHTAAQQRRIFAGPLLPSSGGGHLRPPLPDPGLRFQVLHTDDAAEALYRAVVLPVRGPFNLAADPVVDVPRLARIAGTTAVRVPRGTVRAAVRAAWWLRLVPTPVDLLDAMLHFPLMDTARARDELGWEPAHSATDAVAEWLAGLRSGAGGRTPPLVRRLPGGGRLREAASVPGGS